MFDIFYSGTPPNLFPHEQAARDIDHARELSRTRYFWWTNYLTDYSGFDFLFEPVPWQADQCHVWPSQHQANGGTVLVPKHAVSDTNYDHAVLARRSAPILGINHGSGFNIPCQRSTRFISDYLGTLRRLLAQTTHEYVWVVSSECDYTDFDFTWHPSEWQSTMLHVFASGDLGSVQAFGDTFYIHVASFLSKSENIALLEWFETISFQERTVPRRAWPVVVHGNDSQVPAVLDYQFTRPYAVFSIDESAEGPYPVPSLWREATRTIRPLSPGAGVCLVPRDAKNHLNRQLYDYPYIDKKQNHINDDALLDIVFIDNGEPNADANYTHLKWAAERAHNIRIHRSTGVTGRVAAYRAAAELSTTAWFFAVFAKLQVDSEFDWAWQPDRMQEPKHYIFHAYNPVNGLEYGHQAMIAYNRKLVLENTAPGLDFTLDSAHEVVPIVSGTANYHYSPWVAWRTAFREVIKLKHSLPNIENEYRLKVWLTELDRVDNGKYSIYGAEDGIAYYDAVGGEFAELRKSYDWAWLASYALLKRNLTPDQ